MLGMTIPREYSGGLSEPNVGCDAGGQETCCESDLVGLYELTVNIRDLWRPDAAWLSSFQKIQLAHLIAELRGAGYAPAPERKKSELVEEVAQLFTDAAGDKLEDKKLAERVNRWLPSNLREQAAANVS